MIADKANLTPTTDFSPILHYLLIAFGWSWLFWIPAALIGQGIWNAGPAVEGFFLGPFNLAAWGPLLAALGATYFQHGQAGVKRLVARGLQLRFGAFWYLAIFLLFPVLIGGSLILAAFAGESPDPLEFVANPLIVPFAFLYIFFLGGPLQEEFGWRGFLQDRLQVAQGNALVASIIVGIIWGIWHLPLFYIPGDTIYYERPVWGLVLTTTLISVLFTWIYNNTGRSIFAVLLFHTMFNLSHFLFPALASDLAATYLWGLQIAAVVLVVAIWGHRRLSRKMGDPTDETAANLPQ